MPGIEVPVGAFPGAHTHNGSGEALNVCPTALPSQLSTFPTPQPSSLLPPDGGLTRYLFLNQGQRILGFGVL